jgi:hypothetical protein
MNAGIFMARCDAFVLDMEAAKPDMMNRVLRSYSTSWRLNGLKRKSDYRHIEC